MKKYRAIGLMSGTSLDGLDLCCADFIYDGKWSYEILVADTYSYSDNWFHKLKEAAELPAAELLKLNSEYGYYLGNCCAKFIAAHQLKNIDLISSHGHTVFHQPQKFFSYQLGDGRAIKSIVDLSVVYDFRMQDVLLGGNGAPLVPIGDRLLFSEFESCLNLGGFSNISLERDGKRIAFDICPVNIILNRAASMAGRSFDEYGNLARSGQINNSLLAALNLLEFYRLPYPKSLGAEWIADDVFFPAGISAADLSATFTEHIATQIGKILDTLEIKNVLLSGGGAFNSFLIEKIQQKTAAQLIIADPMTVNYKEALIFALLGVLKMRGEVNVLASATGARQDHSSGLLA